MKNRLVVTVGLAVLFAVWMGGCNCGSAESGADGGPNEPLVEAVPDASVELDASEDAGTVTVDAGTDAGPDPVDAGTGAGDAGPESGSLLGDVTYAGVPGPPIKMVLQDSTGAVKGWGAIDNSGRFGAAVNAGDMVTFLMGEPDAAELLTYIGVKPNDFLNVLAPYTRAVSAPVATLPPGASGATVVTFAGSSACSAEVTGPDAVVTLTSECMSSRFFYGYNELAPNWFSVIQMAATTPALFRVQTQLVLADAGTTVAGGLLDWKAASTCSVELTGAPASPSGQVFLSVSNTDPHTLGGPYVFEKRLVSLVDGGAAASFDCLVEINNPESFRLGGQVEYQSRNGQNFLQTTGAGVRPSGDGLTSIGVDLAGGLVLKGLLPRLSSASHDHAVPRPTVTWTAETPLPEVSVGVVWFSWVDDVTGRTSRWTFIVPPTQQALTAPALPAQWAEWGPNAFQDLSEPTVNTIRILDGFNHVMSYDRVRSHGAVSGILSDPKSGPLVLSRYDSLVWMTSIVPPQ